MIQTNGGTVEKQTSSCKHAEQTTTLQLESACPTGLPWVWGFPWVWVWYGYGDCDESPWVLWVICGDF